MIMLPLHSFYGTTFALLFGKYDIKLAALFSVLLRSRRSGWFLHKEEQEVCYVFRENGTMELVPKYRADVRQFFL